jgi:hypothetical protein
VTAAAARANTASRQVADQRNDAERDARAQASADLPAKYPGLAEKGEKPIATDLVERVLDGYVNLVKEHVDLQGASGATYRFRLVGDPDQLPAAGGNFVYVLWYENTPRVSFCGAVSSLSAATNWWDEAVRLHGVQGLYVRLNVARAVRENEHADLVDRVKPPMAPYAEM